MLALSQRPGAPTASAPAAEAEVLVKTAGWRRLLPRPQAFAERVIAAALAEPAVRGKGTFARAAVNFCLVDNREMRKLNRNFRGQDASTNVLAFPSGEKEFLGDIVLALGTVRAEAAAQKKRARDHAAHLMLHGFLHLLGFTHHGAREAAAMETLETRILKGLGIADPYRAERL